MQKIEQKQLTKVEKGLDYHSERYSNFKQHLRKIAKRVGTVVLLSGTISGSAQAVSLTSNIWNSAIESGAELDAWREKKYKSQAAIDALNNPYTAKPLPRVTPEVQSTVTLDKLNRLADSLLEMAVTTDSPVFADHKATCSVGTVMPKRWPNPGRPLSITQRSYVSDKLSVKKVEFNPVSFTRDDAGDIFVCGIENGVNLQRGIYGEPIGYGINDTIVSNIKYLDQALGKFITCTEFWDQSYKKFEQEPDFDPTLHISNLAC